MTEAPTRHLPLAGTYNLRDVGGYATLDGRVTRWRTLFRADSLHCLTPEGQQTLIDHGLRTVVDLRRPDELTELPNVFAASDRVRYIHNPLFFITTATSLPEFYRQVVDESQPYMRSVIARLSEPGALPALVHCTAGKDRTGLVVAALLGIARVPAATIAEDYSLTGQYLNENWIAEQRQRVAAKGRDWNAVVPFLSSSAQLMKDVLSDLDRRFGGVTQYLSSIGVTTHEIEALRAALTIDGP